MTVMVADEEQRAALLLEAQAKATQLFAAVEEGKVIAPGSDQPMRRTDRSGRICHWILEIHLVDRDRQFGGFDEELLDLGHG